MTGSIGSISVNVVPDATDFWRRFRAETEGNAPEPTVRVRADTTAARAEIDRLRAELARLNSTVRVRVDPAGQKQLHLLLTGALALTPALIPIAGAATAVGAAFVGAGVAGIAAFKGAQAEMKAGTTLGKQYTAQINLLKAGFAGLAKQAATPWGAGMGFAQGIAKISAALPSLRTEFQQLAHIGADIGQHLIGGLVNGFHTFAPLMAQVLLAVDQLAVRFERWSTGPGGAKFAATLSEDFRKVGPPLAAIGELVGRVIAALHDYGLGVVTVFGTIASLLNAIPLPVLSALLTTIIGLRLAGVAAVAVAKLAVATRALGIAAGVSGAGMATLATRAGLVAGVVVGAGFAINAAAKATKDWEYSSNNLARGIHAVASAGDDLVHLHFGKVADDLRESNFDRLNAKITEITQLIEIGRQEQADAELFAKMQLSGRPIGPGLPRVSVQIVDPIQIQRLRIVDSTVNKLRLSLHQLNTTRQASSLSGAVAGYDKFNSALTKTLDNTQRFLALGGEAVFTYKGITVGQNTYDEAVRKSNGNKAAAIGLIEGEIDAGGRNLDILKRTTAASARLNLFLADGQAKYGLTAQQVDLYSAALGISADMIDRSAASEANAEAALGLVAKGFSNANEASTAWLAAVDASTKGVDTLSSRADLLAAGLTALRGVTLSMAGTNLTAVDASQKLSTTLAENSASIGTNGQLLGQLTATARGYVTTQPQLTAGSLAISAAMSQTATSAVDLARSIYANTGNATAALGAFEGLRAQFIQTEIQAGLTAMQAENLATQIFGIPKDAKTFVKLLGKDDVAGAIRDLTSKLSDFSDIIAEALIRVDPGNSEAEIRGIVTWMSYLKDKTIHINTVNNTSLENSQLPVGVVNARGGVVDYYANGGVSKFADGAHVAQIAPAGAMRLWAEPETGGEAYIPLAQSKRARSQSILSEVASRFGDTYQPRRYANGGVNGQPQPITVYVTNPWTGEQVRAEVAHVAGQQVAAGMDALTHQSIYNS